MALAINVPDISPGGNNWPLPSPVTDSAARILLRGLGELRAERDLALVHGHYRYVATLEDLIGQAWRTWRRIDRIERDWTRFEGGARYGDG